MHTHFATLLGYSWWLLSRNFANLVDHARAYLDQNMPETLVGEGFGDGTWTGDARRDGGAPEVFNGGGIDNNTRSSGLELLRHEPVSFVICGVTEGGVPGSADRDKQRRTDSIFVADTNSVVRRQVIPQVVERGEYRTR